MPFATMIRIVALLLVCSVGCARRGEDAEPATGPKVGPAIDKAAQGASKGVQKGAQGAKKGVEKGAQGVKKGVEKGAQGVKKGADAVSKALGGQ